MQKIPAGKFHSTLPEYGRQLASLHHSGLMFAARITLPHFSVSSARSLAKSEDEPVNISLPNSPIRAITVVSARAALTSRLIRSTISVGVPLGAPIPSHPVTS